MGFACKMLFRGLQSKFHSMLFLNCIFLLPPCAPFMLLRWKSPFMKVLTKCLDLKKHPRWFQDMLSLVGCG